MRRSLSDLVTSTFASIPQRAGSRTDQDQLDVDRLNNMYKESNAVDFEARVLKDTAYREAAQQGAVNKKQPRPFQTLVYVILALSASY